MTPSVYKNAKILQTAEKASWDWYTQQITAVVAPEDAFVVQPRPVEWPVARFRSCVEGGSLFLGTPSSFFARDVWRMFLKFDTTLLAQHETLTFLDSASNCQ